MYWIVDSSGTVSLQPTVPTSGTGIQWSVVNGVLSNQGKQLYYDIQQHRFTTRKTITENSYSSPFTVASTPGYNSNWTVSITTAYPQRSVNSDVASFDTTSTIKPTVFKLPLITETSSNLTYPVLGSTPIASPAPSYISGVERRADGAVTPIDLTGFVPLTGMGDVVKSPSQVEVGGDKVTIPTTASWWWVILFTITILIVIGIVLFVMFRPKKEVIPLVEDPLFQTLVVTQRK
jgi:hypothetical protein